MNRGDVKLRIAEGVVFDTHIIVNPAHTHEWIVFFKKSAGRSFFLVDGSDEVESFTNLDVLVDELRQLGIKGAEIHI